MSTEEKPTSVLKKDVVSRKKMFSYTGGMIINTYQIAAYNLVVFYFYEVELGLQTALVGLAYAIFAIWNMVNDPLFGYLTDKPMRWSKKYGFRTPWIIFGGILFIICFYFIFAVPTELSSTTNPWPLFWYMVIVTCLFDTFYTIYSSHYVGGFANIFRTKEERRKGSTIVMYVGLTGGMLCQAFVIPVFIVTGDPSSFLRFGFVSCVILTIALIILLPGIYENEFVKKRYLQIYEFLDATKLPYFKLLKLTFKQKNYVCAIAVWTLWTTGYVLQQASYFYLLKDVLGLDFQVLTILALSFLLTYLISMLIWTNIAKRVAHSYVWGIGVLLMGIGAIQAMWITDIYGMIILYIFTGIGMAGIGSVNLSINSDAMDSVNLAAGRHVEASLMGVRGFFQRMSYIIAGGVIAAVHIATGYVPGATQQSDLAILGIRIHAGLVPFFFLLAAFILMVFVYDLKGEKKEAQMAALRKKGI
jgi:GPH family glycoside/pentoside/hexuronide:cation symporter